MAFRTDEAAVKAIIDTILTIAEVTPFLNTANIIVTDNLAGSSLSAEMLEEIEKWLAAHLVAIRDQRAKSERVEEWSVTYHGQTGTGLEFTAYGQQVLLLDTTGIMASLGEKKTTFKVF